ncbi:hypothetical protein M0654_03690 [Rhizobium sp. NTR19]|uniref:Uncharacterized protein n=1 Tax=Neorhizobium turbinariae TaxID=2937795 RepID=A0ABT0IMI2_9HYPH|nr:hypothetical protein [Neorhizobium turbinariae]MCK8779082.1 hypothetical protein [Neorhizobium turbinariae]
MTRVRFTADFDYKPTMQTTIGYKAGMEETVKKECAEQAIAAGKAEEIPDAGRPSEGKPSGKTTDGAK